MRKYLAALLALLLMAAAFFLPARLARWSDAQLLDVPHVTAGEERESFAETLQLTSGEKLLLLRGGDLSSMDVSTIMVQGLYTTPVSGENGSPGSIAQEYITFFGEDQVSEYVRAAYGGGLSVEDWFELEVNAEELLDLQQWDDRVTSAWTQVRSLQSLGGLPELWTPGTEVIYLVYGDELYLDSATQISFQTYHVSFESDPYSLDLTIDAQSGRIFAFSLSWANEAGINWGPRGSGSFGSAWRDYWKLDKVSDSWYTPYTQEILECPSETLNVNGDYNANDQVIFSYDDQTLAVPLANWVTRERRSFLWWNTAPDWSSNQLVPGPSEGR